MKSIDKCLLPLVAVLLLHGCAIYAVYGLYQTVTDINNTLTQVDSSLTKIDMVLKEGKDLKRAAEDGKLISTLAEKIPSLVQNEVEFVTKEKIKLFSSDLHLSSLDFTKNAETENLPGAKKAYNDMSQTYSEFTGLMSDLSETVKHPLK